MAHHTSSLSTGAKAGVGVGAALAAIAIVGLIIWVIFLRKRTSSHDQARYSPGRHDGNMIRENMAEMAPQNAVSKHEMAAYSRPHEIGEM